MAGLALTACAAPPGGPELRERSFSLEGGVITGTLRIPVDPPGPKPVVVRPVVEPERLLSRGIGVVTFSVHWQMLAPEAPKHEEAEAADEQAGGDPVGRWLLAAPRPGRVGRDYFQLIAGEAHWAVPRVVDLLERQSDVDPERIAIAGSSTTGFVALEALVQEPRLAAGAVRVACGDYHAFLRDSSLALDGNPEWLVDGEPALDADYEAALREREPIRFADAFPPRPLLLVNGAADKAVPADCARETARVLGEAYARAGASDRFRFVLLPGRGHDLGPEAESEIVEWWLRWLHPH